jgi:hypothetical protein
LTLWLLCSFEDFFTVPNHKNSIILPGNHKVTAWSLIIGADDLKTAKYANF